MEILYSFEDINKAIETLKKGGIILYPTDTVWGIGCDARNSEAIKKIYKLKNREDHKSMLVLVHDEASLERIISEIPDVAWQLIDTAVQPLTIIFDEARNISPELIAEDGSIGIRITREKFSKELCKRLGAPIVSTSANKSGAPTPNCFNRISDEIKKGVDYIVKFRQTESEQKTPSNIIKLSKNGVVKIIR